MTEYHIERVGNYGKISPIPQGKLASALLKYMSYERQGKEFMPNPEWAVVKLYSVKKGLFPWGFRFLVKRLMSEWCDKFDDTFNWNFFMAPSVMSFKELFNKGLDLFDNTNLREYQKVAVSKLLVNDGGLICMPTGSGKTKTVIEYCKILQQETTITVTTLDIKNQWEKQVKDYPYIHIINYQSPLAKDLIKKSKVIVFDECHHVSAKTIYHLAMVASTDSKIVGCSATPEREDGESMRINAALGDIVYQISRRELIDQGYLSDADVLYIDLKQDKFNIDDKLMPYPELYKKYIVDNLERNIHIVKLAETHVKEGRKVLILVSQIDHGEMIFTSINVDNKIFLHGSSAKKDREKDLSQFNLIVGSNIFNEGVDLPSFDVLIIAAGGKSSIQLTQRIGRVLRPQAGKKALIIDFIDSRKYLKDHYAKRREILAKDFEVMEI